MTLLLRAVVALVDQEKTEKFREYRGAAGTHDSTPPPGRQPPGSTNPHRSEGTFSERRSFIIAPLGEPPDAPAFLRCVRTAPDPVTPASASARNVRSRKNLTSK